MATRRGIHLFVVPLPVKNANLYHFSSSSQLPSSSQSPNSRKILHGPSSEALISSIVSVLTEQRSKSRWNFLKNLYLAGFSAADFCHVVIRLKNKPHLALRFFIWSKDNALCYHDLVSYSIVIHILARSRQFKTQAQSLIKTAIRVSKPNSSDLPSRAHDIFRTLVKTYHLCDSAPYVFDLMILACLDAHFPDWAIDIARSLSSRGIRPTTGTCNSLIRSVARSRGSEAGFAIYTQIFGKSTKKTDSNFKGKVAISPNVHTFNALMLSFYQGQKVERLQGIFLEMKSFGSDPNVFTYSILIASLCDSRKLEEAVSLWNDMQDRGIKPDIMAFNTMISGFCETGQIARAEALFQEIVFGGIEPTCATFEHLIKGYCKIGDVDSALILYKDMCRRDFRPETLVIDAVVGELCRRKRPFEGLEFLRDVKRRGVFSPCRATYEALIKGFCDEGKMEDALKIQAEMIGRGFEPDLVIYDSFAYGYEKQGY